MKLFEQMAAGERSAERGGIDFAGQQVGQMTTDLADEDQVRQGIRVIAQNRSPDRLSRRRCVFGNQLPASRLMGQQSFLFEQADQPGKQRSYLIRNIGGVLQCSLQPGLSFLGQITQGLEGKCAHQCIEQGNGAVKMVAPMQPGLLVGQCSAGLPHQILAGCNRDRLQILRVRLQAECVPPQGRLPRAALPKGGGAEAAAVESRHGFAGTIEQFELGQHRTRVLLDQSSPEPGGFAAKEPQAADTDWQQRGAISRFDVAVKEIQQRLETDIQQGGVQDMAGHTGLDRRGNFQLRQQFAVVDPDLLHALEGRAVVQTHAAGEGVMCRGIQSDGVGLAVFDGKLIGWPLCQRFADQPADGVQCPVIVAQARPAANLEAAIGGIQFEAQQAGMFAVKHHRRDDVHFFHLVAAMVSPVAEPFARSREGHLDIGCTRQHDAAAYLVIGQIRQDLRVERIFPDRLAILQAVSQQRMHALPVDQVIAFAGFRMPEVLALPRIVGQAHDAGGSGKTGIKLERRSSQTGPPGGFENPVRSVVILFQGCQHAAADARHFQTVADVALQDGIRADFHKYPATGFRKRVDGLVEADRLTNVVPPVSRPQLFAGQHVPGYGGDKYSLAGSGGKPGKFLQQGGLDRVHGATVKCVVEIEQAIEDALLLHPDAQCIKRFEAAGYGDRARAVDCGDGDRIGQTGLRQCREGVFLGQTHRRHAAAASR